MMKKTTVLAFLLAASSVSVHANTILTVDQTEELFSDTTARCDKTGKDDTCVTWTGPKGEVIRIMDSGKRRAGKWEVNRNGLFCITWDGKKKDLCFVVTRTKDGKHHLYRKGKHKSTIQSVESGNVDNVK